MFFVPSICRATLTRLKELIFLRCGASMSIDQCGCHSLRFNLTKNKSVVISSSVAASYLSVRLLWCDASQRRGRSHNGDGSQNEHVLT